MSTQAPSPSLHWLQRLLMAMVALVLLVLLAVAAWLRPSQEGMGTHQQLGLPPCTLVALYGMRCPSCGMTTSWSHLTKGSVWQSLKANSGGFLLGVLAILSAPWLMISAALGRWVWGPPGDAVLIGIASTLVGVILLDWLVRII